MYTGLKIVVLEVVIVVAIHMTNVELSMCSTCVPVFHMVRIVSFVLNLVQGFQSAVPNSHKSKGEVSVSVFC